MEKEQKIYGNLETRLFANRYHVAFNELSGHDHHDFEKLMTQAMTVIIRNLLPERYVEVFHYCGRLSRDDSPYAEETYGVRAHLKRMFLDDQGEYDNRIFDFTTYVDATSHDCVYMKALFTEPDSDDSHIYGYDFYISEFLKFDDDVDPTKGIMMDNVQDVIDVIVRNPIYAEIVKHVYRTEQYLSKY